MALVALATLTPVYAINAQDVSRLCLTRSLLELRLSADTCLGTDWATDKASHGGHLYSDKAPGMSALELPGAALAPVPDVQSWPIESFRLWLPRVLSSGLAFLLCVFLVGRISEGLAPGFGGVSLVVFGLGTFYAPFAVANFEHVTAGTLGLAAFALAWRGRPTLAGLTGGAALLVAYEAALIVLIVAIYVALQGGWALLNYARAVLPGAALVSTYNWLAFGAPWHFSYHYIVGGNAVNQDSGFFGIHLPYVSAIEDVFFGRGGLFVISPVLVAAAYGLVLVGRRYRAEAIVCAGVAGTFFFLNCGYFAPYGGLSPGPRFLIPCLPFLAIGMSLAFRRFPGVTTIIAALSVIAATALTLTWPNLQPAPGTIWGRIVAVPVDLGSSTLLEHLTSNVIVLVGSTRAAGATLVVLAAAGALALSLAVAGRE